MATYVITVLAILVCAYMGWKWYRRSSQGPTLNDTLTESQVIAEFQRRRRIHGIAFTVFVLMFPYLCWVFIRVIEARESLLGIPINFHAGLGLVLLIGSVLMISFVYRCPRCGEPPWAPGRTGVLTKPDSCPSCYARLK